MKHFDPESACTLLGFSIGALAGSAFWTLLYFVIRYAS
jgi:hypothetical protein